MFRPLRMTVMLTALATSIVAGGCASSKPADERVANDESARPRAGDAGADNLASSKPLRTAESQYLVVKFRQNDTEVEMALDPEATNLEVDLKRGPDGSLEVSEGDSVLFRKKTEENGAPDDLLAATKGKKSESLTDEIIEDINLAQKFFYERRYEEALKVLRASLQKKRTATAYALGGSIYYVNGDIDAAVSAWQNALAINPNLEQVRALVARYQKEQ